MSGAVTSSNEAEKSRRSPESEQARKKQKMEQVTFSNPNAFVTFIVGDEGKTSMFMVHKEVVCFHSKVLKAAFNSDFIEGQSQIYRLDDTTDQAFRLLMQLFYSQSLVIDQLQEEGLELKDTEITAEDMALVELWVLADKLCMPPLQNAVLTFHYIYENTTVDSPLRRYTVASCASTNCDEMEWAPHVYPRQMLLDLGLFARKKLEKLKKKELEIDDIDEYDVSSYFI